jgi:hypothetical protein
MKSIKLICHSLAVIGIAFGASFSHAQSFPDRPITLIVPNPPGGLVDTSARLLSEPLLTTSLARAETLPISMLLRQSQMVIPCSFLIRGITLAIPL